MRGFSSDERGISSIVGFLLVVTMLVGLGGYVLAVKGREAKMRTSGLVDAMEDAGKRQRQLLTFVYANESDGALHAYFYNYGTEEITVDKLWVDGNLVPPGDISPFNVVDDGSSGNTFKIRELTEVRVDAPSVSGNYSFTFLTESNSLYSYSIVGGD